MTTLSPLTALSPLDGRYNSKLGGLRNCFSEQALIHQRVRVEVEWLKAPAAEPALKEVPAFSKTTVAELLYERTMLPHRSMDLLRWGYYEEIGYDRDVASEKNAQGGFWEMYRYWKPFEAHAVKPYT